MSSNPLIESLNQESTGNVKRGNYVYIAFNRKILALLSDLSVKLPHEKETYDLLTRTINIYISKDESMPCQVYLKNIKGHEHCFKACTPANVKYFLDHAPKMSLLELFNIHKNWKFFRYPDIKSLWDKLKDLNMYAKLTEMVPTGLMSAVQEMSESMQKQGKLQVFVKMKGLSPMEMLQKVSALAASNPKVKYEMEKFAAEIDKRYEETGEIPKMDIYESFLQRVSQFQ